VAFIMIYYDNILYFIKMFEKWIFFIVAL